MIYLSRYLLLFICCRQWKTYGLNKLPHKLLLRQPALTGLKPLTWVSLKTSSPYLLLMNSPRSPAGKVHSEPARTNIQLNETTAMGCGNDVMVTARHLELSKPRNERYNGKQRCCTRCNMCQMFYILFSKVFPSKQFFINRQEVKVELPVNLWTRCFGFV